MPYAKNLQVEYHQQDTSYYCGAACAQMVLDSIGAGILSQADLYKDTHGHSTTESGWATAPDGLEWTLNDRRPAGFNNPFVAFALGSEDAISRKIAWTLEHYGVATCALVYGSAHWIVVRGVRASDAPKSSSDTSYSIDHFRVNNPWPPVPSLYDKKLAPPPPHSANDGCGTGGNRGVADEIVTYTEWQNTYMTGVNWGHWNGTFVAVCDPEPAPIQRGVSRPRERLRDGSRLIKAEEAVELAWSGMERQRLEEDELWGQQIQNRSVAGATTFGPAPRSNRPILLYYPIRIRW